MKQQWSKGPNNNDRLLNCLTLTCSSLQCIEITPRFFFAVTSDEFKHAGKGFGCTSHAAGPLRSFSWEGKMLFRQRQETERCSKRSLVSRLSQSQCNCACVPEDGAEALTTQHHCSIHVYDRLIKPQTLTRLARLKITWNQISKWVRPTWQPSEVSESERQEISHKSVWKDNGWRAIPLKVKCCHTENSGIFLVALDTTTAQTWSLNIFKRCVFWGVGGVFSWKMCLGRCITKPQVLLRRLKFVFTHKRARRDTFSSAGRATSGFSPPLSPAAWNVLIRHTSVWAGVTLACWGIQIVWWSDWLPVFYLLPGVALLWDN